MADTFHWCVRKKSRLQLSLQPPSWEQMETHFVHLSVKCCWGWRDGTEDVSAGCSFGAGLSPGTSMAAHNHRRLQSRGIQQPFAGLLGHRACKMVHKHDKWAKHLKKKKIGRIVSTDRGVKCLPLKHEELSSSPSTHVKTVEFLFAVPGLGR